MDSFVERLFSVQRLTGSLLCVGLDTDYRLIHPCTPHSYNVDVVDATRGLVSAYKFNLNFYLGRYRDLAETVKYIRKVAPDVLLIADGKFGDIPSSVEPAVSVLFDELGFDAVTVNAWAGYDILEPFVGYDDRAVFVWCRSSNPNSVDIQGVNVQLHGETVPLYEYLSAKVCEWDDVAGNLGVVVGATDPDALSRVRRRCPDLPILIPGIGHQGGDLASLARGLESTDRPNVLVNVSRSVIYPPGDNANACDMTGEVECLNFEIQSMLEAERWLRSYTVG